MEDAMVLFKTYEETPDADTSTVADIYLEPLTLSLVELDMSRLEKPEKPPVPQVIFFKVNFKSLKNTGIRPWRVL
jgi:hypothetical protein